MPKKARKEKQLIIIGGPTASGKTGVAIQLAQYFQTEILSCDSRQFFKEMSIGTAKPNRTELVAAPHHFINSLSIKDQYNVGDYERDAIQLLNQLFEQQDKIILVGGSGLYIQAVCEGLDQFPNVPTEVREAVEKDHQEKGLAFLQAELKDSDPVYYEQVDTQNPHRLMRAISVCRASGQPFSKFRRKEKADRNFKAVYILLEWERAKLYERINQRVNLMLEAGLEQEVSALMPYQELTSLQTVGYQEFFDYFNGKIDRTEAIRLIKRNTRRYAKRQMTWFRRSGNWKSFPPYQLKEIIAYIQDL